MMAARSDDGGQVFGQALAAVEAAFLDQRGGGRGLVQVGAGRGGDQVAEVGEVLVAAGQGLERDQVPGRRDRKKTSGRTSSRSARRTTSSLMPELAKSRSMNALDAPASGLTSRAVASRLT